MRSDRCATTFTSTLSYGMTTVIFTNIYETPWPPGSDAASASAIRTVVLFPRASSAVSSATHSSRAASSAARSTSRSSCIRASNAASVASAVPPGEHVRPSRSAPGSSAPIAGGGCCDCSFLRRLQAVQHRLLVLSSGWWTRALEQALQTTSPQNLKSQFWTEQSRKFALSARSIEQRDVDSATRLAVVVLVKATSGGETEHCTDSGAAS